MGHQPGFGNNPSSAKPVNTAILPPSPPQIQKFVKGAMANVAKAVPTTHQQRVALAKLHAAKSRNQALIDCLQPLVWTAAKSLLRGVWLVQAQTALNAASLPQDPISGGYAAGALLGNIIWAAACLNPEAWAVNALMSFGGAIVGSGAFTPVRFVKDGKGTLREALNAAEDDAESKIFSFSKQAASLLVGLMPVYDKLPSSEHDRLGFIEAFVFWAMFPGMSYEHKQSAISAAVGANITRALGEFDKQYKARAKEVQLWLLRNGSGGLLRRVPLMVSAEDLEEYAKTPGHEFKADIGRWIGDAPLK